MVKTFIKTYYSALILIIAGITGIIVESIWTYDMDSTMANFSMEHKKYNMVNNSLNMQLRTRMNAAEDSVRAYLHSTTDTTRRILSIQKITDYAIQKRKTENFICTPYGYDQTKCSPEYVNYINYNIVTGYHYDTTWNKSNLDIANQIYSQLKASLLQIRSPIDSANKNTIDKIVTKELCSKKVPSDDSYVFCLLRTAAAAIIAIIGILILFNKRSLIWVSNSHIVGTNIDGTKKVKIIDIFLAVVTGLLVLYTIFIIGVVSSRHTVQIDYIEKTYHKICIDKIY